MNIFFIYPNSGSQVGFNYGLAHIASMLKKVGHNVGFWQLCEDLEPLPDREEFIRRLRREQPDVIGFSVVTNQWSYTRTLAQWARQAMTVPLVCGGVHALVAGKEILESDLFDYIFRGESEEAFLEFVNKLERHENILDTPNLGYIENSRVQFNPVRPLPQLENLPFKDYTLFDFQKLIDIKNGWVGLMASRGCPFACTYCFNHKMVDIYRQDLKCSFSDLHYIRRFRVDQMIEEIAWLQNHYQNITMFIFDDDLFTFDTSYVRQFCSRYPQVSRLPFVVNAHVGFFDEECARALAGANCKIVKLGVESGSEKIRKHILNRHMSNKKIGEVIHLIRKAGMHSSVFIIIGFPHETLSDLWATVKLLARTQPGRFRWTWFFPFPGTKAHQISQEGGFINQGKMANLTNFTDQSCLEFGPEQNLLLRKIGKIMPWFVNACSDLPVAEFYLEKVNDILDMNENQWQDYSPALPELDKTYSAQFVKEGLSHYAIKYNRFMGVLSDYFIREE